MYKSHNARNSSLEILEKSFDLSRDYYGCSVKPSDTLRQNSTAFDWIVPDFLPRFARLKAKRLLDLGCASMLLVALGPLLVLTALVVRCSGREIIYQHERVGQGGRTFSCLKFRTMIPNAEEALAERLRVCSKSREEWRETRKLRDDPRITTFGRFLRRSSLDELPQLINVIRGEMSMVGPRPVTAEEIDLYGAAAAELLSVSPGLTGLWQVSGRNEITLSKRMEIELEYVRTRSLRKDLLILLRTVNAVLIGRGAY
ncbi:sugar transferase (plasmid) [Skermanella rosea]|uniref:sugar transferase n=1 Tax=Skermanella rosea TaxID=1817965 RepID=UPI001932E6B2|nr:sugar transferase [Skermanella rosea]UEM07128.1 sugar transferase [Skermanella rosea]